METSFDHNTNDTSTSNNPFLMNPTSNGPDSVPYQKGGLLLDLGGGGDAELTYKQNGTSPSKTDLYFLDRPANGKNTEGVDNNYDDDDDDDDDFGPETDVDAVDDVLLSPAIAATKAAALLSPSNNNPFGVSEFEDKKEKEEHMTAMEADLELQRQQTSDFDLIKEPREETPTPPADEVPGLTTGVRESDNVAESGEDSEDEWNYFRVEPTAADPEKNQQTTQEVCKNPAQLQLEDESNMESQLNPDAAEFVPSPTQMTPSVDEVLLAESPKKGIPMEDISIPSQIEFQHEASQRPSELDLANEPSSLPQQKLPDLINCEEGGDIGNPFLPPGAICGKSIHHLNNEGSFSKLLEQGDSNFQEQNGVFVDQQCSNIRETVGHIFDDSEVSSTKVEFGDDSTSFLVSGSDLQNTIENISFSALEENVSFSTLEESLVDQDLLPTEHVTDVTKSDNASPFNELSEFVSETCMNNSVGRENVQHEEANNLVETSIERMPMSFELCKELIPEMECKPERVLLESEGTSSFEQDDSGSPVQAEDTKLEDIGEQPVISPLHSAVPVHEDIPVEPEIEDDIAVPLAADLHCTLLGKESPVCESESLTDDQPASPLQSPKPVSPLQAPTPEVHIPSLWGTTSPVPCLADTASTPETLPLLQDIQSPSPVLEMKSPVCENPPSIEDVESPVRGFESPLLEQESSQLLADDSVCKDKSLEGSELLECITQEATHENIEVDKTNSLDPMNLCMYSAADNAELQPLSKIDESTEMLTCEKLVEDMSVLTTEQKELIPILLDETNSTVPHVEDIVMPPIPTQMSEETPEIVPISQESRQFHETIPVTSEGELSAAPAIVAASAMVVAVAAAGVGISSEEKSAVETKSPEKISTETKKQDKKGQVADKTKTTKMPSTAKSAAGTSAAKTLQKSTPTSPTKPVTASVRSSTPRKPSTPVSTTTTKVTKSPATPTSKPKMGVTSPTKPISTSTKSPAASSPRARPGSAATTTTTTTVTKSATLANGDLANKSAAVKKTITKSTRPVTAPATTKTATTKTSTATSKTTALSAAPPRPKPGAVNGVASKPRTTTTVTTASARSKVGSTRDTKLVTDKQIKETANKQISSTRTITAKSTTTTGVRSTATTASRKVTGVTKTTTATATTTIKSSTGKVGTKKSTITTTSATRTASTSPPKITKTAVTAENNELV